MIQLKTVTTTKFSLLRPSFAKQHKARRPDYFGIHCSFCPRDAVLVQNARNGSVPKLSEGLVQQQLGPVSVVKSGDLIRHVHIDHLRNSSVSESFPISTKHVVDHSHIAGRLSTVDSSEDSTQPVAPDLSAHAYSAIPIDDSVTVSSPVSVSSSENTSSASVPVACPARSRKPIRQLIEDI